MVTLAALFDQQALEPPRLVPAHLDESVGGVAGAEVVPPSPREQVQLRNDPWQRPASPRPAGQGPDTSLGPLHRPPRRPPVQAVADDRLLLPQPPGHPGMQMTARKVKTLPALPQADHAGSCHGAGPDQARPECRRLPAGPARPAAGTSTAPQNRLRGGRASRCRAAPALRSLSPPAYTTSLCLTRTAQTGSPVPNQAIRTCRSPCPGGTRHRHIRNARTRYRHHHDMSGPASLS